MNIEVTDSAEEWPHVKWQAVEVILRPTEERFLESWFPDPEFPKSARFGSERWSSFYRIEGPCYLKLVTPNQQPDLAILLGSYKRSHRKKDINIWLPADHVTSFVMATASSRETNFHGPDYYVIIATLDSGTSEEVTRHYGSVTEVEELRAVLDKKFIRERPRNGWTGVPLREDVAKELNVTPHRASPVGSAPTGAANAASDDDPI